MSARRAAIAAGVFVLGILGGWIGAAPFSTQVEHPSSPTTGYIDPTAATYNGNKPMRCTASATPESLLPGFSEQNRLALQQAITDAAATGKWIWIPRCQVDALNGNAACPADDTCGYPIPKHAGTGTPNIFGVAIVGVSNITLRSDGAVLRQIFDAASINDYWMFKVDNTTHLKFIGLTFSQRDITHPFEQDHVVELGSLNVGTIDDVLFLHCRFIEGEQSAGDMIRSLGSKTATISRVSVINNDFDGSSRAGVSFQRGYRDFNIIGNTFRATHNGTDIHNEPTSEGPIGPLYVKHNEFDRNVAGGAAVTFAGNSLTSPETQTMFVDNVLRQGFGLLAGVTQAWVSRNVTLWDDNTGGDPSWTVLRRASDVWFTDNWIKRGPTAADAFLLTFFEEVGDCGGGGPECVLHDFWVTGNRLEQYGAAATAQLDGIENLWFEDNTITYHNASSNTFVTVLLQNQASTATDSGWFTNNRIAQDLQADGVTPAGLIEDAFSVGSTAGLTGHMIFRDNRVKGATVFLNFNGTGVTVANMPDGIPVATGNILTSVTSFDTASNSAVKVWRTDPHVSAESLAGPGAISIVGRTTTLTAAGAYTLAAGAQDGVVKHVLITPVVGAVQITMTTFGDGSEVDNVSNTAGAFDVAWDAADARWRLLGSRSVTVVP